MKVLKRIRGGRKSLLQKIEGGDGWLEMSSYLPTDRLFSSHLEGITSQQ